MARRTNFKVELFQANEDLEALSLIEISEVLSLLELILLASCTDNDAKKAVHLSLSAVDSEQSILTLSMSAETKKPLEKFCKAIADSNPGLLPRAASIWLYELNDLLIKLDSVLEFTPKRNLIPKNCYLPAEEDLKEPVLHIAHGTSILQGKLIRVGGQPSEMTLELLSGQTLTCHLPEKMAIEISSQIYNMIAFHGRISWETDGMTVRAFQPTSVTTMKKQSIRKSFENLSEVSSKRWKETNAIDYLNKVRGIDKPQERNPE